MDRHKGQKVAWTFVWSRVRDQEKGTYHACTQKPQINLNPEEATIPASTARKGGSRGHRTGEGHAERPHGVDRDDEPSRELEIAKEEFSKEGEARETETVVLEKAATTDLER